MPSPSLHLDRALLAQRVEGDAATDEFQLVTVGGRSPVAGLAPRSRERALVARQPVGPAIGIDARVGQLVVEDEDATRQEVGERPAGSPWIRIASARYSISPGSGSLNSAHQRATRP
jgi:hypothetical protein